LLVGTGALNALLAVAMGAFGAHGLRGTLGADLLAVYQTGVLYHLVHALGLVLVGAVGGALPSPRPARWAGWSMLVGILLFSGSLYLLVLTGQRWLGVVTPLGGTAFLVGWGLLALAALRHRDA
jgi:uncharacterized membrane protein YgdD (TMEM256/DUF423 family)